MGRFWHCAVPLSSNSIFVAGGVHAQVINEDKYIFSDLTVRTTSTVVAAQKVLYPLHTVGVQSD